MKNPSVWLESDNETAAMRILITGSTGFIGQSVGKFAAAQGHEVIGVARRSQADIDWAGSHVPADIAQSDMAPLIANSNPDLIFHGAGTASVAGSLALPLDDLKASVVTFANLLDGVRRSGKHPLVIFPSSAAVYGNPSELPVSEDAPARPISPYGFHKLSCELLAREFRECFGINTIVLRVFSVFGPAQRRLLVWELFEQFRGSSVSVKLRGSGQESRDYVHVDDLASAVLALAQYQGKLEDGILNLASGIETRISDVAALMRKLLASDKRIEYLGRAMSGDPVRWVGCTNRISAVIPTWKPRSFSVGIDQLIKEWSRSVADV